MIRKLFLLALTACAAALVMAPAASAEGPVHVHNPGMFELEGTDQLALQAHTGMGEVDQLRCDNEWEANVSEDGHVDVHDVNLASGPNSEGPCDLANDCDDAGWEGQIHEGEGENPPHEFEVNIEFCLSIPTQPDRHGEVTCEVSTTHAECIDAPDAETGGIIEVDGEISFHQPGPVIEHG